MLRSALLTSAAFAFVLGAYAEGVEVSLRPVASCVDSIDDIVITAIVSNPTNRDIRLLAINNILDSSFTQSFSVSKDDKAVGFTGIRAIYDMSAEDIYKVIPAGSSVAVNHTNIAPLYDFEAAGAGKFKFVSSPFYLPGTNTPISKTPEVVVHVTHDVLRRKLGNLEKSTPTCTDATKLQFIKRTFEESIVLARNASTDIRNRPTSAEIKRYFKTSSAPVVQAKFDKIAADADNRIISCTDKYQQCPGTRIIAYTALFISATGTITGSDIFTCPSFFTDIAQTSTTCKTGYDSTTSSDGGVVLHELSHANSATKDLGYGCSVTEGLSAADQLNNADNFRCMSLAVYKRNSCLVV